jgi:hypothetical protein
VTPRRRGTQKLVLVVIHRKLPNRRYKAVEDAVLQKEVAVTLDPFYVANSFMRTHRKAIVGTILSATAAAGLLGIVLAHLPHG